MLGFYELTLADGIPLARSIFILILLKLISPIILTYFFLKNLQNCPVDRMDKQKYNFLNLLNSLDEIRYFHFLFKYWAILSLEFGVFPSKNLEILLQLFFYIFL
jgi:hypothetical protein